MIWTNFGLPEYLLILVFVVFLIFLDSLFSYLASLRIPGYFRAEFLPWNRYFYKKYGNKIIVLFGTLFANWMLFAIFFLWIPIKITWIMFFFGFYLCRVIQSAYRFALGWLFNGSGQK